jgi:Ser/Thr protein kinase RdoA (MazF antagonist)
MNESLPDLDRLNSMFQVYSPNDITIAKRSTETFANEVYDITDSQGMRYFMKLLKSQHPQAIAAEVQMQKRLAAAGIGTPEYIQVTPGQYVGSSNGTRFILSNYIAGESPKTVTPLLTQNLGAFLAKFHNILEGTIVSQNNMQWLRLDKVQNDLTSYNGTLKKPLQTLVKRGKIIFNLRLPEVVIHGDLWLSNIFAKDDQITTVFDLETAQNSLRVVDLARTYTSLRINSTYTMAQITEQLFNGYDQAVQQPLTTAERDSFNLAIQYVAGACATWHATNGTRYAEPYMQLGLEAQNK